MIRLPTQPYEREKQQLLKQHPGKALSIFINWENIAECLKFDYQSEIILHEITDANLIDLAFSKTQNYINSIDDDLEESQILEIENRYLKALKEHWSLSNILLKHIDFKRVTKNINDWAQTGPKNNKIFGVSPKTGFAIDYFANSAGISFTLYEPFMIPYTELYYMSYDSLPEWNFEDLTVTDVIMAYTLLEDCLGKPVIIDLSEWNNAL